MQVKIVYLYHSGVWVDTQKHVLIFDCFVDRAQGKRSLENGVVSAADLSGRDVSVFASHSHQDHFNPVIFNWQHNAQKIEYYLSNDIHVKNSARFVAKGDTIKADDDLNITVFGSTDKGVSFLVEADGLKIFHAGDLNLWHWRGESSPAQVAAAENAFIKEMQPIAQLGSVDIAFFPVDPRMGEGYAAGARYYLEHVRPKLFVPIHFADDFATVQSFTRYADANTKIFMPSRRGDSFTAEF